MENREGAQQKAGRGRSIDMLHGPLAGKMVTFALPLAATGILQQLFNAADVAVVGRFAAEAVRTDAQAAVGANATVVALFLNFFIGLSLGAGVFISAAVGQGNEKRIRDGVHTAVLLGLIAGLAVAVAGQFLARPILRLLLVPEEILDMAVVYLRIYLGGMPVILLYNFEAAILRSVGDTRTPLYSLVFSGTANVALNLFFVVGLHMAASGVALATVIANSISALYLLARLLRSRLSIRLEIKRLRLERRALVRILALGAPAGLQSMVFALSNTVMQSAINSLGKEVMAASVAAYNLELNAYHLINSFGQASTTFIGQNHAAGNDERCRQVTRIALLLAGGVSLVSMTVLLGFSGPLLSIFNEDPAVVAYGTIRMKYVLYPYLVNVVMEIMSGSMRGYGQSLPPAVITAVNVCGIRILWTKFVFPLQPDFAWLMACYPLSWVVNATGLVIAYLLVLRYISRQHRNREGEEESRAE